MCWQNVLLGREQMLDEVFEYKAASVDHVTKCSRQKGVLFLLALVKKSGASDMKKETSCFMRKLSLTSLSFRLKRLFIDFAGAKNKDAKCPWKKSSLFLSLSRFFWITKTFFFVFIIIVRVSRLWRDRKDLLLLWRASSSSSLRAGS